MKAVNKRQLLVYALVAVMALGGVVAYFPQCKSDNGGPAKPPAAVTPPPAVQVTVPPFSADSAYAFIKKQVDFGPRVPGTPAHAKCAAWLAAEFRRFGLTVVEQKFEAPTYFGKRPAVNIIGQYKPELHNRILLCAHWDSRHIADNDTENKEKPILGADDGGSGVGVLLEIARLLQANPANIGVDFVLFDAEDLGDDRDPVGNASSSVMTQSATQDKAETWCLGSQHWAKNPHKPGYTAQFGILLDMVGAIGARFPREGYSSENASAIQERIWNTGIELGYGSLFVKEQGGYITDDHLFVMRDRRIPTVDIIGMPNEPPHVFGAYHHTHADNMSIISKATLQAVGHTVTTVLYRTEKGVQ